MAAGPRTRWRGLQPFHICELSRTRVRRTSQNSVSTHSRNAAWSRSDGPGLPYAIPATLYTDLRGRGQGAYLDPKHPKERIVRGILNSLYRLLALGRAT